MKQKAEDMETHVWWDIEACPIPESVDPALVVNNIVSTIKSAGYLGTVLIEICGDTDRVPRTVGLKLSEPISHVSGDAEYITARIRERMIADALDFHPWATNFMIISGDTDFVSTLETLRGLGHYTHVAFDLPRNAEKLWPGSILWPWRTLAAGLPTVESVFGAVQTVVDHTRRDLYVTHEMFKCLSGRSDAKKSSFTPKDVCRSSVVVVVVGIQQGSSTTSTCKNYANFYEQKGCEAVIVDIDISSGGALYSTAVEEIERCRENYDLIVVDTGAYHLSREMDRMTFQIKKMKMDAFFEATKPDLVLFVVDTSLDDNAVQVVDYFHLKVPSKTGTAQIGIALKTGRVANANKFPSSILSLRTRRIGIQFIERGENVDELVELMKDFEAFDGDRLAWLLLGMCDWTVFIDPFTLRRMLERYRKLDQVICSKHYGYFFSRMGLLDSMKNEEFEGRNPNTILKICHSIWSNISICNRCKRFVKNDKATRGGSIRDANGGLLARGADRGLVARDADRGLKRPKDRAWSLGRGSTRYTIKIDFEDDENISSST